MEIACPGILLSHLPTLVGHRILSLPPSHLNQQIIFRDSRFPYREANNVVLGMNKKRDMKIACPGIILYDYPQKLLNHQQINSVILSSVTGFYSK